MMVWLYLFAVFAILQTIYYLGFRFFFPKPQVSNTNFNQGVSVIVCAKNEAAVISNLLRALTLQSYPKFEIILINDHSTDDTWSIFQTFSSKHPELNIQLLNLTEGISNKKKALAQGIKLAKYDYLLLTDADCQPQSKEWISLMLSPLSSSDMVLGYGAYKTTRSFLNRLIRYETLLTAMQYFSYANAGMAYMGVGRNLAYKKKVFYALNGFETHQHIASGDDDLFVNEAAQQFKISAQSHPQSKTISEPKTTWSSWIQQKRRHITTAHAYSVKHQFLLGLFYISQLGFFSTLILTLAFTTFSFEVFILILARYLAYYTAIYSSAKALKERGLMLGLPFYEISVIFMQLYVFTLNKINPPKSW